AAIVWFVVTPENVNAAIAPADVPSITTFAIVWHASAAIENDWLAPHVTATAPDGVIEPPAPALAVMVNDGVANVAAIVWLAVTFANVYAATAPTEPPSTVTSAIVWQASGAIVYACEPPHATGVAPAGAIEPPAPALAVRVNDGVANVAAIVWFAVTLVNVYAA